MLIDLIIKENQNKLLEQIVKEYENILLYYDIK